MLHTSWKETSKLIEANCSTRAAGRLAAVALRSCHCTMLSALRQVWATPLGVPVEPEV